MKLSDPSSGFTLAGEPGRQSQKVDRRIPVAPMHFLTQPNRQNLPFSDPLAAVVNGITPINSTATGPSAHIGSPAALPSPTNHHHNHQSLIVATIKLKQIADSVRNDLAMSVVIENSQLVATESNLAPIGD
jgi:hypothetical protein